MPAMPPRPVYSDDCSKPAYFPPREEGNFSIYQDMQGERTVVCHFTFPNGERKEMQYRVDRRAGSECIAYIKDALLAKAKAEIRQEVERTAQMVVPQYYHPYGRTGTYDTATGAVTTTTATYYYGDNCVPNELPVSWDTRVIVKRIKIKHRIGKKLLEIEADVDGGGEVEITEQDIDKAKIDYLKTAKINIITRNAENKAEDLLKMFISEIDFRDYKQKGYFTVKAGDRAFRIHRDKHKHIDMWEKGQNGVFMPKNRLCSHTERRELPYADEALQKLMLVRSNRIIEHSNLHSADGLVAIEKEKG